jgi:hypothetical protein
MTLAPNDDRLFVDRDTELPETACREVAYRFWDLVESIGAAHRDSELSGGNVRGHTIENVRHLHRHYRSRLDALVAQLVGADPEGGCEPAVRPDKRGQLWTVSCEVHGGVDCLSLASDLPLPIGSHLPRSRQE